MTGWAIVAFWGGLVFGLANQTGWRHCHTRRSIGKGRRWTTATSVKGWPDYYLWHELGRDSLFVELKADDGRLSPDQERVITSLRAAGLEVHVWRPRDAAVMDERLTRHIPGRRLPPTV